MSEAFTHSEAGDADVDTVRVRLVRIGRRRVGDIDGVRMGVVVGEVRSAHAVVAERAELG